MLITLLPTIKTSITHKKFFESFCQDLSKPTTNSTHEVNIIKTNQNRGLIRCATFFFNENIKYKLKNVYYE
jgi:hypothetical protein